MPDIRANAERPLAGNREILSFTYVVAVFANLVATKTEGHLGWRVSNVAHLMAVSRYEGVRCASN